MTRHFPPEPSYHLFYDLGASSLGVSLVSLKSAMMPDMYSLAAKPDLRKVTSLTVHGVGFDVEVGGFVLDRTVRDLLIEEAQKSGLKDVTSNKRAMAKLLKEATRVKQVLSANTEAMARVSRRFLSSRVDLDTYDTVFHAQRSKVLSKTTTFVL